jgi:putative ABC transport system substrate-binding protein
VVEGGVAESLTRPGRNVTGLTLYAGGEHFAKLIQLLHETKPSVKRIGALLSYVPPLHPRAETDLIIGGMQSGARSLGIDLRVFEIANPDQIKPALVAIATQQVEALVLTSGPIPQGRRQEILEFAAARHLPTIAESGFASPGPDRPLLIYSASYPALMEKVVPYIDQILWRQTR